MDPETVACVPPLHALDRDCVVEVLGIGAVDGHARKVAQVLSLAQVPTDARRGRFLDFIGELAGGLYRGEERLVDVARVVRGSEDLRHLAAQGTPLLADAHQNYVTGLGAAPELAGDQDRATLLDEQGVRDRVLPPADQLGWHYHAERGVRRVLRSNTHRVYHGSNTARPKSRLTTPSRS